MKRLTLVLALVAMMFSQNLKAQTNIQEMYDFGRGHFTTTLEMFKADNWGSTFFFTDIYHPSDIPMPTGYYTEISRSLNFWGESALKNLSLHVEWNGGQFATNAWLFGVDYFFHNNDFTNTLTLSLMYKEIRGGLIPSSNVPLQFTAVWGMKDLFNVEGLTFSGFLDMWWENTAWPLNGNSTFVILSEPQIWYNVGQHFDCENLYVGGEVELAYNFAGGCMTDFSKNKGFTWAPCLGVKWIF